MTVINEKFVINTQGFTDIIDITKNIQNCVYRHSLPNASVLVYAAGSTVGITNIEFEPGVMVDLQEALDKIAPMGVEYHHLARRKRLCTRESGNRRQFNNGSGH